MKKLNWDLMQLTLQHQEGSFATQGDRWRLLDRAAKDLDSLGFKGLRARGLKVPHVAALVRYWQAKGLSTGTIKNRMCALRWWAAKVGNRINIPANVALGIPDRVYATNENKATSLDDRLLKVNDPYIRMSLELQAAFGLRREEAIKIRPAQADQGNKLVLKDSWTKGGRPREIPIRNEFQREVLDRARQLVGDGALIRPGRNYILQRNAYDQQCRDAGLENMHGLRHAYAQTRYRELTGRDSPVVGGIQSKGLSKRERQEDRTARLKISNELGHGREQVTVGYLGR